MRDQVEQRLAQLKSEFETGQARMRDLDRQQAHLRETLLRISGAIQVLEELVDEDAPGEHADPSALDASAKE